MVVCNNNSVGESFLCRRLVLFGVLLQELLSLRFQPFFPPLPRVLDPLSPCLCLVTAHTGGGGTHPQHLLTSPSTLLSLALCLCARANKDTPDTCSTLSVSLTPHPTPLRHSRQLLRPQVLRLLPVNVLHQDPLVLKYISL